MLETVTTDRKLHGSCRSASTGGSGRWRIGRASTPPSWCYLPRAGPSTRGGWSSASGRGPPWTTPRATRGPRWPRWPHIAIQHVRGVVALPPCPRRTCQHRAGGAAVLPPCPLEEPERVELHGLPHGGVLGPRRPGPLDPLCVGALARGPSPWSTCRVLSPFVYHVTDRKGRGGDQELWGAVLRVHGQGPEHGRSRAENGPPPPFTRLGATGVREVSGGPTRNARPSCCRRCELQAAWTHM